MLSQDLVIMIHGFTSNKNQFRKIKKEVESEGKEVVCVQLHSHEDGEDNQEFKIQNTIEEVEKIIEEKENRRIIIVGESIGAIIAIKMAMKYAIKKLILLSTPILGVNEMSIRKRLEEKNNLLSDFGKQVKEIKKEKIEKIKKEFDGEAEKAKRGIEGVEIDCVVMYGEKDEEEYEESAKEIMKAIKGENKKMIAMRNSGHSLVLGEEKIEVMNIIKEEVMGV